MRSFLIVLPIALMSAPALGQAMPPSPAPVAEAIAIPPELNDPVLTDRLVDAMHTMSQAFLNLPVGEIEAAVQGRQPTSADRRRTIRSESRMTERELRQKIEEARPAMHAGRRALTTALPAILGSLSRLGEELEREVDRATANLPQPGYPRR